MQIIPPLSCASERAHHADISYFGMCARATLCVQNAARLFVLTLACCVCECMQRKQITRYFILFLKNAARVLMAI